MFFFFFSVPFIIVCYDYIMAQGLLLIYELSAQCGASWDTILLSFCLELRDRCSV